MNGLIVDYDVIEDGKVLVTAATTITVTGTGTETYRVSDFHICTVSEEQFADFNLTVEGGNEKWLPSVKLQIAFRSI